MKMASISLSLLFFFLLWLIKPDAFTLPALSFCSTGSINKFFTFFIVNFLADWAYGKFLCFNCFILLLLLLIFLLFSLLLLILFMLSLSSFLFEFKIMSLIFWFWIDEKPLLGDLYLTFLTYIFSDSIIFLSLLLILFLLISVFIFFSIWLSLIISLLIEILLFSNTSKFAWDIELLK